MHQHADHLPFAMGIEGQPTSARNHPLAAAIVEAAKERGNRFGEARDFNRPASKCVVGSVDGGKLAIGSRCIMVEADVELSALTDDADLKSRARPRRLRRRR
ncbi:hypothetical protein V5F77_27160 [Xanthobacter sp. DSM 24535]|jgi:cation transport ATPase|uniref:hypothetical protein n=1 Tax=Xanthobacteraceae TaxID=335928 RepID=UPI00372C8E70